MMKHTPQRMQTTPIPDPLSDPERDPKHYPEYDPLTPPIPGHTPTPPRGPDAPEGPPSKDPVSQAAASPCDGSRPPAHCGGAR